MKSKLLAVIWLLVGLAGAAQAQSQIIDDTTKALYSPKTTLQLYENDVLEGRYILQRIDTSINNMQNERFWYQDTAHYQHLGNVGTAAKPILFRVPDKIGARLGKNVFDRYAYHPHRINYFDTRSPYSHIYYIQGQRGEQIFEATHARNITPRWNAGVAYQIISGNRQIGPGLTNRDGVLSSQAVKAFTHYRSENEKYHLFANFTHLNHEQIEFGGITADLANLFLFQQALTNLSQASTRELRNNYHLLHMFKLAGENLKLFHSFDWGTQNDIFQDDAIPRLQDEARTPIFYPSIINDALDRTDDRTAYREMENVAGVTGNNKISFYKAYAKLRNSKLDYRSLATAKQDSTEFYNEATEKLNQLFVGGELRLMYRQALLSFEGEFQMTNDYKVGATAKLGPLQGRLMRVLRSPSLVEQRMISNHFEWTTNFNNSVTDRLEATIAGKLGERQYVRLTGHYNHIKRHIYFDTLAVPKQSQDNQQIFGVELQHHIRFGKLHFENFVAYTNTNEDPVIRIPEWLFDSKLYFEGPIFRRALVGQFGVQVYTPTSYFADAYMPVTQQFHLQDKFTIEPYPIADVFITADIKSLNVFLKMSNIASDLTAPGYFTTPYYPGMRTSFVFGIKWMFFD
ncbi:putative porin [Pontibacter indicus]|uniref:Putative porin n=1 Tax=Pontibacter indicus TaxID=1317125 RepID=A0A1R3WRS4_9BACT|nr:putative porin [Pontibacter indicus]SIT79313.1 Putative porin [Pontibacter indicus]